MDIQSSSATIATPTAATGSASSLESSAKAQKQAATDVIPAVKAEAPSADVDGGKLLDLKV
ncbi:MAG: hypothetical protein AAF221_08135 [Pseudomonadota bacterium]